MLYLHSTMYLLNPVYNVLTVLRTYAFTFHYVSIKSAASCTISVFVNTYLHSTMYLLNLGSDIPSSICIMYLHSTMYLLNPDQRGRYEQTWNIYIPLCIY